MNFVMFNEADGVVKKNHPYLCGEPEYNFLNTIPTVDVIVDGKIVKVFLDDVGVQFYLHVNNEHLCLTKE